MEGFFVRPLPHIFSLTINNNFPCLHQLLLPIFKIFFVGNMLRVTHKSRSLPHLIFIDFQAYSAVPVKDEAPCKVGSDHGEEEMEVDSTEEQEQDARNQGGKAQIGKSKSAATFNTLSSLSSLRPGTLS